VRKFAAMNMARVSDGSRPDLLALVVAMERWVAQGDLGTANAARNTLIKLTKIRLPLDARAWRQAIGDL